MAYDTLYCISAVDTNPLLVLIQATQNDRYPGTSRSLSNSCLVPILPALLRVALANRCKSHRVSLSYDSKRVRIMCKTVTSDFSVRKLSVESVLRQGQSVQFVVVREHAWNKPEFL